MFWRRRDWQSKPSTHDRSDPTYQRCCYRREASIQQSLDAVVLHVVCMKGIQCSLLFRIYYKIFLCQYYEVMKNVVVLFLIL